MEMPKDPNILVSMINMKLRDGGYDSLTDLCGSLGIEEGDLKKRLASAGFEYIPSIAQFR